MMWRQIKYSFFFFQIFENNTMTSGKTGASFTNWVTYSMSSYSKLAMCPSERVTTTKAYEGRTLTQTRIWHRHGHVDTCNLQNIGHGDTDLYITSLWII